MTESNIPDLLPDAEAAEAGPDGTWLADFLYPRPAERTLGGIVGWWEKRRLAFNAIVGTSGLVTISLLTLVSDPFGADGRSFMILAPIMVYGIMANLCFTLGSFVEVTIDKLWGKDVLPVGPALWRSGLIFSVGLTLVFPMILMVVGMIMSFVLGFF